MTIAADRQKPRFSVVLPTVGRPEMLRETLIGLVRCEPPPDEILVVDGGPTAGVEELVRALASERSVPRLEYLTSPRGTSVQRNIGIDRAQGEVIVFVDDDLFVERDVFARLSLVYSDPRTLGASGHVVEPLSRKIGGQRALLRRLLLPGEQGRFTRFGYPRYVYEVNVERDVEWMPGCFMTARREAAASVRFDEHLRGYSLAEDEDFALRLSRLGRIRYVPEIIVYHQKTGFRSIDSRSLGRMVVQNRSYLFRKNFPQTPTARLQFQLLVGLLLAHRLVNRDLRGARGILEGRARSGPGNAVSPSP